MDEDAATTRVSLASRLNPLLLANLFVMREARDRIHFRYIPSLPSSANPSDVLRSFRPEILATTPVLDDTPPPREYHTTQVASDVALIPQ